VTFDSKRIEFNRQHIWVVELELDYCTLTSGVAPCTATETGDAKCFNTIASTNDLPNYTKGTKIYRFCSEVSPHPIGIDAIPSLKSVNVAPAEIDVSGGLGIRSSVSLTFSDSQSSDIGIDKYITERTWSAFERGTFWTKLRARNPNYQFRPLRVYSGYLDSTGAYDLNNFQVRHFIIERMDVSGGEARITGKDPLKLASQKKAQAPAASTGTLASNLTSSAIVSSLAPAGVGNSEYATSGWLLIDKEIVSFTRSADTLNITRAQYNTVAATHSAGATVQQCLEYSGATRGKLDFIVKDLLTNFASVDAAFIPDADWASEISTYLSGLLSTLIPKPFDVWKLLRELSETMPHYLWWDERNQQIQLTALKAPPTSATVLNMDGNLVEDSVKVSDVPGMRVSSVLINFGQFDPTKRLDEPNNYEQSYVRVDTDSINTYLTNEFKVINSRWISNTNKAAALQATALIGRRFSDIPRAITFSLDAKDADTWPGTLRSVNHRDMVDFTGVPEDTMFQIISVKENDVYQYNGLEFKYGAALPEDEGGGDPAVDLVVLGSDQRDVNLRTVYNGLFPAPTGTTQAKFIVDPGVIIGSTSTSTASIDTGTWPAGAIITLVNKGTIAGKGGSPSFLTGVYDGGDGGLAINMSYALTLDNLGVIGGGGGAGADSVGPFPGLVVTYGGGGAGDEAGSAGATVNNGEVVTGAGDGGDQGQPGVATSNGTGGAAGDAIHKNFLTLTQITVGTINGTIA